MSLTCGCPTDFDLAPGGWYWENSSELYPMKKRKKRRRCCSCKNFINEGELQVEYTRTKITEEFSVEYWIYGEEKRIASWHECEECFNLRLALEELGFCVNLGESMRELVKEYNEYRKKL